MARSQTLKPMTICAGILETRGNSGLSNLMKAKRILTERITPNGTIQVRKLMDKNTMVGTVTLTGPHYTDTSGKKLRNQKDENVSHRADTICITIIDVSDSRERYDLDVKPGLMIKHLRDKIERLLEIDAYDADLNYSGQVLENGESLRDYGVDDGDEILLRRNDRRTDTICVTISYSMNRYDLDVKPGLMVEHLRDKIERLLDIDTCDADLKYSGQVLEDGNNLRDYGVDDGDEIVLRRNERIDIEVYDRNTGDTIDLYINTFDKIRKLKWVISWKNDCDVRPGDQILYYEDEELDDDNCTVDDYNIPDGARLDLSYY